MVERLYFLLGGPVLGRELKRGQPLLLFLHPWLVFCLSGYFFVSITNLGPAVRGAAPPFGSSALWNTASTNLEMLRRENLAIAKKASEFASWLLHAQLLLILLLVPPVSAGAIVHEKERDTLQALFGTELGAGEIVAGKIFGRLGLLVKQGLAVLPLLVLAAATADLPALRIGLALLQAAALAYAVVAACLFVSLWTRRTADAIVGCYSVMVVAYLVGSFVLSGIRPPDAIDPVARLDGLLDLNSPLQAGPLVAHFAFLSGCGTVFLILTAMRLRPICLKQTDARPPRLTWAFRPVIGENPISWREYHVFGVAPLPVLRMIPRWIGLLGVFAFSLILACGTLDNFAWKYCFTQLLHGDYDAAIAQLRVSFARGKGQDIDLMGGALIALGGLTVCVRCATALAEEKWRKTWDDLLLTPLTREEILYGKYRGILKATVLPLATYSLPMLLLGATQGMPGLARAGTWMAAACAIIPLAGAFGLALADVPEPTLEYGQPVANMRNPRHR
jgi:ABC-type transport system involved in multi-copper enzyme maturation permease subunit